MQHPTTGEPEVVSQSPILADGRGYLLAVVCVGLAWLLRWALDPLLLGRLPYGFFSSLSLSSPNSPVSGQRPSPRLEGSS